MVMVAFDRQDAIKRTGIGGQDDGDERNKRMPRHVKLEQAASQLATNLAENCRKRRAKLGISQAELSERTGVAASHLSYIEHGRANPTLEILQLLANGLGCSVLDLLSEPCKA
jgi:ribosome-binding protein aMBF1 (putative translation factor)